LDIFLKEKYTGLVFIIHIVASNPYFISVASSHYGNMVYLCLCGHDCLGVSKDCAVTQQITDVWSHLEIWVLVFIENKVVIHGIYGNDNYSLNIRLGESLLRQYNEG